MTVQANVVPGVHRITDSFTNWYLIEEDERLTVVDAGVPSSWDSLRAALRQLGQPVDAVEAIVLTHAHFDPVGLRPPYSGCAGHPPGTAERARRELGIPVHVHEDDAPVTRHPWRYDHERPRALYLATQVRALPIVATFLRHRAFWPAPIREVVRFGDDAGVLPVPGSPQVVPCPGHTLGHCALHLPDRDVVLAGDAFVTLDPYTARTDPRLVARAATADAERNARTLDALVETGARTVLTGHGEPWTGGVEAGVAQARAAGAA